MHIGKRLLFLRKKNGLSLEQAAVGIVSPTHLSNIENGRYYPNGDILKLLAKKYKVSENYLVSFDRKDTTLDEPLHELLYLLISNNMERSKEIIEALEKENPIPNVIQEISFYILKIAFLIKINKPFDEEFAFINNMINEDELTYPDFVHQCYVYSMSQVYFHQRDYENCYNSIQTFLKYNHPETVNATMEFNLLLLLYYLNKPIQAIKLAEKVLKDFYVNHLWDIVVESYMLLFAIYFKQTDYEMALYYTKQSLEVANLLDKNETIKSKIYHNFGITYKGLNLFEEAIVYLEKSIELKKQLNLSTNSSYWSILDIYAQLQDEESFYRWYNEIGVKSEEIEFLRIKLTPSLINEYLPYLNDWAEKFEKQKKYEQACQVYYLLGNHYYSARKYKLSINYHQKVFDIIRKTKGSVYV
ncbi:helix-turn-helix transcriptional regulator [Caldibacillus lycopersici]|uniref:Helix-turn-helix transcriptional regulator n=1 Tax=Perspicuibacillus lycopersici TaxID=1325689 RepID=A0AAE3LLP7_9BACI|nr:helix-turn-helix transcriptional regulator [Perspicuibacillus lycopersici]MCU9611967.1 helix-turn-helix transcriptional regulator [Perspicuibacillus lycopersici]